MSSRESLGDVVDELQEENAELRERVDQLEQLVEDNLTGAFSRIASIDDRVDDVHERIDGLEDDLQVASATSSSKKASKIDKAMDVLEMASRKRAGFSGVTVDSGEVLGAASCSNSRARDLMDEMAGAIEGAETEIPGGPYPKVLRLPIADRDVEELQEEILEQWGDGE